MTIYIEKNNKKMNMEDEPCRSKNEYQGSFCMFNNSYKIKKFLRKH